MSSVNFGSPWMAAAGGLGQGLGQGMLAGAELAERKRKEQQQKQHDAMTLLMQGIKNIPDDPQEAQQYMEWFGKVTGQQLPPYKQAKSFVDKFKAFQAEAEQIPGLTSEQKNDYVWQRAGLKVPKAATEKENWVGIPDATAPGGIRYQQAPKGNVKIPTAMMPSNFYGPGGQVFQGPPNLKATPEPFKTPKSDETTKQTPLTPSDLKVFDAWEEKLNASRDPAEKTRIVNKIRQQGGDVQKTGKNQWTVLPPEFKKTTTSKGQSGGLPQAAPAQMSLEDMKKEIEDLKKRAQ